MVQSILVTTNYSIVRDAAGKKLNSKPAVYDATLNAETLNITVLNSSDRQFGR